VSDGDHKLRLGGMALRNGLLVHGPTHWAAAVRDSGGDVQVASGSKPNFGTKATERVPGLRGVTRLGEALAVIPIVKRALPAAQLPMQDRRTLAGMAAAATAGHALRSGGRRTVAREAMVAGLSLLPALLALRGSELASYHGAEHKTIGGYEKDTDAIDVHKEHERCGSNLVAPLLASTAAGNVAARRAGLKGPMADAVVGLGSVALAVEVFAWSERHTDSTMARLLRLPGHEIQRVFGTREPSAEQLDVAHAALSEILRVEG
jgi:uncharacterized protein YqhQ